MHSLLTLLAPVLDPIVRIDFAVVHFFNQFANQQRGHDSRQVHPMSGRTKGVRGR